MASSTLVVEQVQQGQTAFQGPVFEVAVPIEERRRSRRRAVARPVRLRLVEVSDGSLSLLETSENVSHGGLYLKTRDTFYKKGMRFVVTFPFVPDTKSYDYLGEVVRVDVLPKNAFGVALRLAGPISS